MKIFSRKPSPRRSDITGHTIFHDRPLRFRNLTLTPADLPTLKDPSQLGGAFKIRLARRPGALREARTLVRQRYGHRGYSVPAEKSDPCLLTLLAVDEDKIVGTVGVRVDSEQGLDADELYREEVDTLRAAGSRVCEFTRLAIDTASASKPVLAGLFHTAYLYAAVTRGHTHAVIEVNPRHVHFYTKALPFAPIGPERLNRRVEAPAILLCTPFAAIAEGTAKYAGQHDVPDGKHYLFRYGFPPDEESGVLQRLRALSITDR